MYNNLGKVNIPADLQAAANYADAVLNQYRGKMNYKVYCPDDFCANLELSGLPLSDGNMPLDKAFVTASLDMTVSVIHSLAGGYAEYSCREEAVWASVKLLAAMKTQEKKAKSETVEALFAELCRSWEIYIGFNISSILRAAEPNAVDNKLKKKE